MMFQCFIFGYTTASSLIIFLLLQYEEVPTNMEKRNKQREDVPSGAPVFKNAVEERLWKIRMKSVRTCFFEIFIKLRLYTNILFYAINLQVPVLYTVLTSSSSLITHVSRSLGGRQKAKPPRGDRGAQTHSGRPAVRRRQEGNVTHRPPAVGARVARTRRGAHQGGAHRTRYNTHCTALHSMNITQHMNAYII